MKISYIAHSALLIETKSHKILTDPWLSGATYCDQWHLFPLPTNCKIASTADVILITHGHEDHLHHNSLTELNKNAQLFYPFQWQKGVKEYLNELGYINVTEAITYKSYTLSDNTKITYIANALDSIIIIESDGKILLNVNDALPANHVNIIKKFTAIIKKKWPKIDYLFCGYGSAAYFPNTVHCEGKNDVEVAEAREQLFAHNFCNIVNDIKPKFVVPFAADYVLLNDSRKWINDVKLSKYEIQNYYINIFKGTSTEFLIMHSGDIIDINRLIKKSPYHEQVKNGRLEHLIDKQLSQSEIRVNKIDYINQSEIDELISKMKTNINLRVGLFNDTTLKKVKYTIVIKDIEDKNCFFVDCSKDLLQIQRSDLVHKDAILRLETTSKILNYCFDSEWGGDAIIIGYGAEIYIQDESIIQENLDIVCVRLLTRQPIASKQMKSTPFRALRYLATNPLTTSWAMKQFVNGRKNINKNPINERNIWLSKTKCEICQVCDIPYISSHFTNNILK